MQVDLLFLSRDMSAPRADIWRAIEAQRGLEVVVHRVTGPARPDDANRFETITRAEPGTEFRPGALVMLLDDDVVLAPDCIATLANALMRRPQFAALAADSAGEMNREWEHWDYPSHVGMAAVLFRREALQSLTFRWEDDTCECRCCCADLRAAGRAIGYLEAAKAWHLPAVANEGTLEPKAHRVSAGRAGRILAAFDRRDQLRFRTQFLTTLRESGNAEEVWAFAYGLYPSELDRLAAQPGVTVVAIPGNGVCPALRRLRDFQDVISRWPADAPVAYWDAGDVLFQGRLDPLWNMIAGNPNILLVTEEPKSYPENPVIRPWADWIDDPAARDHAFEIMSTHVFLNSGFAAGTAAAVLDYCREGDRLLHSNALRGVGDWGDQPALNLYCHANPMRWRAVDPGWNYTLAGREDVEYTVAPNGRAMGTDQSPVHVLHGNAGFIRWLDISPWSPAARLGPAPIQREVGMRHR